MTTPKHDQELASFLRDGLGPVPAAATDLESRIWQQAQSTKKRRWLALSAMPLLVAAAALVLVLWPRPAETLKDDDEQLAAFVEAAWDGTFDDSSETYALAQLGD